MNQKPEHTYTASDFSDLSKHTQNIRSALLRMVGKRVRKTGRGRFRVIASANAVIKEEESATH